MAGVLSSGDLACGKVLAVDPPCLSFGACRDDANFGGCFCLRDKPHGNRPNAPRALSKSFFAVFETSGLSNLRATSSRMQGKQPPGPRRSRCFWRTRFVLFRVPALTTGFINEGADLAHATSQYKKRRDTPPRLGGNVYATSLIYLYHVSHGFMHWNSRPFVALEAIERFGHVALKWDLGRA